MEMYLLKSGICLAILYGFYKLFLENESMHVFKRFYLLGALGISFLIPLITFTTYVEMPVTTVATTPVFVNPGNTSFTEIETTTNYLPFILWGLYALGVLYFSIKFGLNLKQIYSRIKKNPNLKRDSITHVLLKPQVVPHTFLSYVFLNKKKYEAQEIPEEVLEHEHIHAKQKHSIDILLVELLQILFWFNPLIYFIKRSIKLNHEFLADRAVLKQGVDPTAYQKLLLAFSSHATTPTLANSINYLFIKKRFTVMKKQTSTKAIWLRSLLILPLVAILIYGFSTKELVQKQTHIEENGKEVIQENFKNTVSENKIFSIIENSDADIVEHIQIHINSNEEFTLNGYNTNINTIEEQLKSINPNLSKEDRKKRVIVHIYSDGNAKMGFITDIKNKLLDYGVHQFVSLPLDSIPQKKATKAEIEEYNKLAKKYNTIPRDNMRIASVEVDRMKFIYNKMTTQQKENAEAFPRLPEPPPAPPVPKDSNLNKNSWVKDFDDTFQNGKNNPSSKNIIFTINDDESFNINNIPSTMENYKTTLKSLFKKFENIKSDEEIQVYIKSEELVKWSFIQEVGEELKKYNIETINVTSGILDDRNEKVNLNPPAPPTPPTPNIEKDTRLPPLPAPVPPAPLSNPIEYIKALHKSGAVFYIGPHQYNYEEVLEMAKKSKDLNIDISEYPKVNLLGC